MKKIIYLMMFALLAISVLGEPSTTFVKFEHLRNSSDILDGLFDGNFSVYSESSGGTLWYNQNFTNLNISSGEAVFEMTLSQNDIDFTGTPYLQLCIVEDCTARQAWGDTGYTRYSNKSNFWDDLDTPSDINAGDITDDGTYVGVGSANLTLVYCGNITGGTDTDFCTDADSGASNGNSTEEMQDAIWTSGIGTTTGITVTYQDGTDDVDFEVTITDTDTIYTTNVTKIHFNESGNIITLNLEQDDQANLTAWFTDSDTTYTDLNEFTNILQFMNDEGNITCTSISGLSADLCDGSDADTTYSLLSELGDDIGFYDNISNFSTTLTDTYWCRYNLAGDEINCDVVPITDTDNNLNTNVTKIQFNITGNDVTLSLEQPDLNNLTATFTMNSGISGNPYGYINGTSNITGTVTDGEMCTYNEGTQLLDCNTEIYVSWTAYMDGSSQKTITNTDTLGWDGNEGIALSYDASRDIGISFDCSEVTDGNNGLIGCTSEDITLDTRVPYNQSDPDNTYNITIDCRSIRFDTGIDNSEICDGGDAGTTGQYVLNFTDDSAGDYSILDTEVMTFAGGDGITTSATGNTLTITSDVTNTDEQTLSFSEGNITISGSNDEVNITNIANIGTLDGYEASSLLDNTDAQTLSFINGNITITGSNDQVNITDLSITGTLDGYDASELLDNTDEQTISFANGNITISGSNDQVNISDIDNIGTLDGYEASALLDNTDAQTLTFANGNITITGSNDQVNISGVDTDTTCDGNSCAVTNTGTLDGYEGVDLYTTNSTQQMIDAVNLTGLNGTNFIGILCDNIVFDNGIGSASICDGTDATGSAGDTNTNVTKIQFNVTGNDVTLVLEQHDGNNDNLTATFTMNEGGTSGNSSEEIINAINNTGYFNFSYYTNGIIWSYEGDGQYVTQLMTEISDYYSIETDNTNFIIYNEGTVGNEYKTFELSSAKAGSTSDLYLQTPAIGHSTQVSRSLRIGFGEFVENCEYTNCDTSGTGGDLELRDELWTGGNASFGNYSLNITDAGLVYGSGFYDDGVLLTVNTDTQTLSYVSGNITISGSNDQVNITNIANIGTLDGYEASALLDNTDAQTLSYSNGNITISGSDDQVNITDIANIGTLDGYEASALLDNTDAQTLSFAFGNITISGSNDQVNVSGVISSGVSCTDCLSGTQIAVLTDDDVSDTLTCSDLVAGSEVVSDSEVVDTLSISGGDITLNTNTYSGTLGVANITETLMINNSNEGYTFLENATVEGFIFNQDSTNHRIWDNTTCIIIRGDTATLNIC